MRLATACVFTGSFLFTSCVFAQGASVGFVGRVVHSTCPISTKNAEVFIDAECNNPHAMIEKSRTLKIGEKTNLSANLIKTTFTQKMRGDTPVGRVLLAEYL